jgi:DNA-directed RNA polymerase subunit omega
VPPPAEPARRLVAEGSARGRDAGGAPAADYTAGPTKKGSQNVISPRIDSLLENVDSNYASVVVAAKRARQINSYYHNLGEGTFDEFPPPMVETASKNYLTIALEEVAAGKLKYHYR